MIIGVFRRIKEHFLKWYKGWGLAAKLFFIFFLVTFAIFMFMQWNNLREAKRLLKNQNINDTQLMMLRTNQFLDAYLDNINNVLFLTSYQKELLKDGNEEAAESFLRRYGENNSSIIKNLFIIRKDGKTYSSRQLIYDILGNSNLNVQYKMAQEGYGGISWSEPYYSPMSDKTIAFSIPIKEDDNSILGVAVVEVSIEYLRQRISPWLVTSNQAFIVMSQGDRPVVYDSNSNLIPYQQGTYPYEIHDDFSKVISGKAVGINYMDYDGKALMTVKSNSNNLGWKLVAIIDQKIFNENITKLYRNFIITAILWVVVLLVGSFLLSYYFTNPIRKLALKMDRLKDLDNLPIINIKRSDEIGRLAASYNSMMKRINNLVCEVKLVENQKKEYELKMLQSQIGPHFLYNTLACIGSLAKQQKTDEVRETIRSLVGLLSFSFDKRGEFVTLEEELEGLNAYINIQKIRYGNIFDLDLDIDEKTLGCGILKLTLQPIIENSIFHGIVPKQEYGSIKIHGEIKDSKLVISIWDNGMGMDEEKCRDLLSNRTSKKFHDRFNSIGITNVNERIQIHFGAQYGINIESRKNVYTIVTVTMPVINSINPPI